MSIVFVRKERKKELIDRGKNLNVVVTYIYN